MALFSRRISLRIAAIFLLLLSAAGHIAFWYWPRERPAVPDLEDLPGRLLTEDGFEAAVWVPFPHQNLAVLGRGLGGGERTEAWLAAAGRLAGFKTPSLPTFGPFRVPPSRSLAVASGEGGRRVVVAARVYPALALIARLAGRVAGNPWLAGGEVQAFGGAARVSWDGSLWTVASAGALDGGGGRPQAPAHHSPGGPENALAIVHLGRGAPPLPAAVYRLRRPAGRPGDLELVAGDQEVLAAWQGLEGLAAKEVVVAVLNGAGGPLAERPGALLFFAPRRGSLPTAAALSPPGAPEGQRLRLPHERLPALLRGELARAKVGDWAIVASGKSALAAAEGIAPELVNPLPARGAVLWLDPRRARSLIGEIAGVLEQVPLVRRREARRWRDWEAVLAPLGGFADLELTAAAEPEAFRLRLRANG